METKKEFKPLSYIGFAVLLILYAAVAIFTPRVSQSQEMWTIGQARLPVSALTGVLSSMGNLCLICLVVFYHRLGFIVTMAILAVQMPIMISHAVVGHNLASVPGLFINLLTIIASVLIRSRDKQIIRYRADEMNHLKQQQQTSQRLFEQTATALVTAIDAKDEYSHGHSMRVAEYARKIAEHMGKSEEDCRKVYFAGLLHDVGKIGIADDIISKKGRLTKEEYEEIKKHPVLGNQILSSIRDYPYISVGAHYHHERYDGRGYPDGLKGEDIPEIARIISVADAYDAMSSNRSYRRAIPQQIIREEIVAGAGTQFDPEMAMIMRHLIDLDGEYKMKEREAVKELAGSTEMHCGAYRSDISEGIIVLPKTTRIHLAWRSEEPEDGRKSPAIILFDSLDARVHDEEDTIRTLNYYEYCEIFLDGETVNHGVRAIETTVTPHPQPKAETPGEAVYDLEALKCKDHIQIRIDDGRQKTEVIIALPDSSRYAYIGLTGQHCVISDVRIVQDAETAPPDSIRRIAEEISYIDGPVGDVPNVQVDGIRTAASEGVPVQDGMKLTFHTMSLPTARLIWHCPYIVIFHSADGQVGGEDYREYAVVRLDGENWDEEEKDRCRITIDREEDFKSWDAWKEGNKAGFDCAVTFGRAGNLITLSTRNLGLSLKAVISLPVKDSRPVYAALTGDQCAITNIRVGKK